ncbi:MAG TPA: hypothetical protein VGF99_05125 [Myxococcota bacterium]
MPSATDFLRCAVALLLVLGTATVFGAALLTRHRDDEPEHVALTGIVLVAIPGIVVVAFVLEALT